MIIPRFVAWYLFGVAGCASPILYSTVNTIVKDDSEERALIMVGPRYHPYLMNVEFTDISICRAL